MLAVRLYYKSSLSSYLKGQGSGLLKFKGQGPEMVNVEEQEECRRPYPKNVHQPWPLALKSVKTCVRM